MNLRDKTRPQAGRLPITAKLGYGMGDLYGGGSSTVISMYFLFFLTDVMGLNPALAGLAFLVSKIWDAVTDPFMGIISDNTRTRFGRRRPYFLAGIFLIGPSFVLMWVPVPFAAEAARFLYFLAAYLFFSTVYTIVWVPYTAIASEMTFDYDERTRLATWRMICSNLSAVISATAAKDFFVQTLFPHDPARGFLLMAVTFGLFFSLPYIATFSFCREREEFMHTPKRKIGSPVQFLKDYLMQPFQVRPFRNLAAMYLFGFIAQDSVMALAVYYLTYKLGVKSMMTLLVPVFGCMMISVPIVGRVSRSIGKRATYLIGCGLWFLAFTLVPAMDRHLSTWMILVFGAIFGAAASCVQVMVFAMIPDIPDVDELFSGSRREGLFTGFFAFGRKAGSALIMLLVGASIEWAGYRKPTIEIVDGVTRSIPSVQTEGFLSAITIIFMVFPLTFVALAAVSAWTNPLTKSVHDRLKAVLAKRREKAAETASMSDKAAAPAAMPAPADGGVAEAAATVAAAAADVSGPMPLDAARAEMVAAGTESTGDVADRSSNSDAATTARGAPDVENVENVAAERPEGEVPAADAAEEEELRRILGGRR